MKYCIILAAAAVLGAGALPAAATPVYLNHLNTTVSLGASHGGGNPFADTSVETALVNAINADTALTTETHAAGANGTHVWVSGGHLELDFAFDQEYDLTQFHIWNYHTETYDVDQVDLKFYSASNALVGELTFLPDLGVGIVQSAQTYDLAFPQRIQYVNAWFTGTNGQVDFNNVGFTGTVSEPLTPIPLPAAGWLLAGALGGLAFAGRRQR